MELVKLETPELQGIEKSKAEQIKSTFVPMAEMLAQFEDSFNEIIIESQKEITLELTSKAKRLRLDIGKIRIQTGKLKDEQKAEYLRASNAIQGVHNILVWAVTDKENKLKEIENYFEVQEKLRLEKLQGERVDELSKYVEDASERNLSSMDVDVWNAYLAAKKKEYIDRIEAEKQAELDRIAKEKSEKEEQERIRKENEQLKKEAEEKERLAKIEREKIEKERENERKKQAEILAKQQKEAEEKAKQEALRQAKIQAELNAKAELERKERAKLENELRLKKEAEQKKIEEEKQRLQAELNRGDAEKVTALINDLNSLKSKYTFQSAKNKKMYTDVNGLIDKIVSFISK